MNIRGTLRRRAGRRGRATAATADDLEPVLARLGRRLRADRDDRDARAGRRERARGRARRRAARRRPSGAGGPQLDRAVERDEVGAALVDEQRRAPSAAARSTRPGGSSASSPSCVETAGTRSARRPCSRSASAVPGPIAATCAGVAGEPARELARAVRARDDDPVVRRRIDRLVAERLDRGSAGSARPRGRAPRAARRAARPASPARVTTILTAASADELAPERDRVVAAAPLDPRAVLGGDRARRASRRRGTPRRARGSRRRPLRPRRAPPRRGGASRA